ncbi:CoA transferase [Microtetraspora sp. NBRC 16547]|uniref:CaiB/BaiF CoA-transferase family protein n=1 Tax=Microtetraspora sp. NBRC 16547 TaxID=3030993 RepID=UPI0024A03CE5|nr:CoA transferase [Microtetraspora sp. NBRC 16547]GLX02672.1 putative CoA-transferase [Microtetraspora sp. NBRC 16547]
MATVDMPMPLDGLRVLDLSDSRATLAARLLADLGADVIRIEVVDDASAGPDRIDPLSLAWAVRNANKRVVRLREPSDQDRRGVARLLAGTDILLESGAEAGGLLPSPVAALHDSHPHLTVVSVSDFGATGPYSGYVGTDAILAGMGWMLYKAGTTDRPPVLPPASMAYDISGVMAAFAALIGVHDRRRTGTGQHLDVSIIEALQQTTDWALPNAVHTREIGQRSSEVRSGGGEAQPVVACRDGWVRTAVLAAAEWRRLREWMGDPPELDDPAFDALSTRVARWEELKPYFLRLFADLTMVEASEEGQRRRIPVTPVLRPSDVLNAVQYDELGTFVRGPVGDRIGEGRYASGYWTIDGTRAGFRAPARELPSVPTCEWRAPARNFRVPCSGPGSTAWPLQGIRVLDLGIAGAAPETARLLAEYGADVVRVESPNHPDLLRQLGGESGMGPTFISTNRCKRSFGVDLSDPRGVGLLKRLAAEADVLVENLAPGALDRFGIDLAELRRANPELITLSSQMMGPYGPWRGWRGYGANTQPPGGLTYLWSYPDLPEPIGTNLAFPDHVAGRLGALAVVACLLSPSRSARHVDLVQAEVGINLLAELYLRESLEPGSVRPAGNASPEGAPWGVYRCAGQERWCVITVRDDTDWANLVTALGDPVWATEDLRTEAGRRARAEEVDRHIQEWTSTRTDQEVMSDLQAHGVPAGYVMYPSDIVDDPHLSARGYPVRYDQPHFGSVVIEGGAFRSPRLLAPILTPAPLLGEHTTEIALDMLWLDDQEVKQLVADAVLFQAKVPPTS